MFWYQVHGEYSFRFGVVEGVSVRNKLELAIIASSSS
jgi:hypothetical protein